MTEQVDQYDSVQMSVRMIADCDDIPMFFIHGDKDTFVPYEMLDKVYEACASEKEKVTIENSPHARNACVDPELYWTSITNFINKYI